MCTGKCTCTCTCTCPDTCIDMHYLHSETHPSGRKVGDAIRRVLCGGSALQCVANTGPGLDDGLLPDLSAAGVALFCDVALFCEDLECMISMPSVGGEKCGVHIDFLASLWLVGKLSCNVSSSQVSNLTNVIIFNSRKTLFLGPGATSLLP